MHMEGAAQMGTVFDCDVAMGRWAIDELLQSYVSWREECHGVRLAYRRWVGASRAEGRRAYAAYVAALDREEHAARAYAGHIERFLA
jgi:hypothetical protein